MAEDLVQQTKNLASEGKVGRFGGEGARPWKEIKASHAIVDVEAAPTKWQQCAAVGVHEWVEILVVPPAGITAYTITYGRWFYAKNAAKTVIDQWHEDGSAAVATGVPRAVLFRTQSDLIGFYISAKTGSADPDTRFRFYFRGANGPA